MRGEWISGADAFAALAEPWRALEQDHPFADHVWLTTWYAAFADGGVPRVALAWRGDELAAAFPLLARGRRLETAANYHSPLFAVPAADAEARAAVVAAALAHGLAHHDAGRPTEALWWWQYSYLADWGDRAGMAVRVLQTLLAHIRLDADADVVGEAEFDALHS